MNGHQIPLLQRVTVVRTPENIELRYALAGPGSRAAAYFLDLLIMSLVGQLLLNMFAYLVGTLLAALRVESDLWMGAMATLLLFGIYNCYFVFFEWLLNGQTPGKRIVHIRVIKQGGYALRFIDTLLRNLLRVIDFIPLFYGVGLVSILLSRQNQRLGDIVAGTLVVYQEPVPTESLLPELPETEAVELVLPPAQVAAVPGEALALAAEFLRTRIQMAPRPRQELAGELIDLISRFSGLEPALTQSAESFLATLLRQAEQTAAGSVQTQGPS